METPSERKDIHRFFVGSILAKGAFALVEVANGLALFVIPTAKITRLVVTLSEAELERRPTDRIAEHLLSWAESFSLSTKTFAAVYLLSHGLIKLALIVALLRERLWAYPLSIFVFSAFIAYQLYRYAHTHSIALIALSVFDAIVLSLIIIEWRNRKAATGATEVRKGEA